MTSQFLFIVIAAASAHTPSSQDIEAIDGQCRALAAGKASAAAVRTRVFADVSTAVLPKPREGEWREFSSEDELRAFADHGKAPNTEAVVSRAPSGVTLVSMYFQSPTAEWAHVVDYCYRPTGTLARVRGTFNSYVASATVGIRRRRTTYFDGEGAVLRSTMQVSDLATDKPLRGATFADEDDPLYPAMKALPFSSALSPPAQAADKDTGLARTVKEHLPAVRACHEKAARHAARLGGRVVARWTIDATGAVTAFAWEDDRVGNPMFASCAKKVLEGLKFPAPADGPTTVAFPFVFESTD